MSRVSINIIYIPSIPNNITNWRVFKNANQIIDFLTKKNVFSNSIIDEDVHEINFFQEESKYESLSSSNTIPKHVTSLEKLFDLKEKFRNLVNPKINSSILAH